MFTAGDARRYPGFFTRTWTPPPEGVSGVRGNSTSDSGIRHATPPLLTPRLAPPIHVRGLTSSSPVVPLNSPPSASSQGLLTSRALVGMSREEPCISPNVSTLNAGDTESFSTIRQCRRAVTEMSREEQSNYIMRLEEDIRQMSNALHSVYQVRDHYKGEAARLHKELMDRQRSFDRLEQEHKNCRDVIHQQRNTEQELRERLDASQTEVRYLKSLVGSSGAQQKATCANQAHEIEKKREEILELQRQNKALEVQLGGIQGQLSKEQTLAFQQQSEINASVAAWERGRRELKDTENLIKVMGAEMNDLREQIQKERVQHEESLWAVTQERNNLQMLKMSLAEEVDRLRELCQAQSGTIDSLNETILKRPALPVNSDHDEEAVQNTIANLNNEGQSLIRDRAVETTSDLEKQTLLHSMCALRQDWEDSNSALQRAHIEMAQFKKHITTLEDEISTSKQEIANYEQKLIEAQIQLSEAKETSRESESVIRDFKKMHEDQNATIYELREQIKIFQLESKGTNYSETGAHDDNKIKQNSSQGYTERQRTDMAKEHMKRQDGSHIENTEAQKKQTEVAQQKLCAELRETQARLREAEEQVARLTAEANAGATAASGSESASAAVDVRSTAEYVSVASQLSAALAALDKLAEEREAMEHQAAEHHARVLELEEQARVWREARSREVDADSVQQQLDRALATISEMAAERDAHAAKLAELSDTVSRLEGVETVPEHAVEALCVELRETQARLREAEEQVARLTAEANAGATAASGSESASAAVDVRSTAEYVSVASQLSAALAALDKLAEEREAMEHQAAEHHARVLELEEQARVWREARSREVDADSVQQQLDRALATISEMAAERDAHAAKLAELSDTASRLEGVETVPEHAVEALCVELRETQARLREAEEQVARLTAEANAGATAASGSESASAAVDVRSTAEYVSVASQLSAALAALDKLAEEREAMEHQAAEHHARVLELEEQARVWREARSREVDADSVQQQLDRALATISEMAAERDAHAAKLAELSDTVSRLEGVETVPEHAVEALCVELRETQARLREAEEQVARLTAEANAGATAASGSESASAAVDVRSTAEYVSVASQLSAALAALDKLAEEREAMEHQAAEHHARVLELEEQARVWREARSREVDADSVQQQLDRALATISEMAAERDAHAAKLAELSDTVSRLEGVETVPEHAVEALCVELRETQARLREAEEQVARLTAEANAGATAASGSESASAAVDVRSTAEYVSVASQLSAALAALDKLAEEREAMEHQAAEHHARVLELEEQARVWREARSREVDANSVQQQLDRALATISEMAAERDAHAAKLAELSDTASRLEGVETVPEHAVEALCVELRETQARLREAEEQVARLTAEANAGATAARGSKSASAAAERDAHAAKLAELSDTVSRLEGVETVPEHAVEALCVELRETQARLREAEEQVARLTAEANAGATAASGSESASAAVDVRSTAEYVSVASQLSAALAALDKLAEEREAMEHQAAEHHARVLELEEQARVWREARSREVDADSVQQQLDRALATISEMAAERDAHAAKLAELSDTVSRLEGVETVPEHAVEALCVELRETQARLREAEEQVARLTAEANAGATAASGSESASAAVDVRSTAEYVSVASQLSAALAALDKLAEEREAMEHQAAEHHARVLELEEQARVWREARSREVDADSVQQQLDRALATISEMAAERDAHAAKLAELSDTASRLEGVETVPEHAVEALCVELRETQARLREAEEQVARLTAEANAGATAARGSKSASAAAERDAHAAKLAELSDTVSRLEGVETVPEHAVEALCVELRETQARLREAEEQVARLTAEANAGATAASGSESASAAVDVRSTAEYVSVASQLSAALAALDKLAEEREAMEHQAAEHHARVLELEEQARVWREARSREVDADSVQQQLDRALATISEMAAERDAHAAKLAELSDTVSRLEGVETVPEHAVEALCAELRETQARLREAEEQVARLTAEANAGATAASGSESASAAVDVRSTAEYVSVASQLSAALAALDKLAEEREAMEHQAAEHHARVLELEEQARVWREARSREVDADSVQQQLDCALATISEMAAERDAHAAKLAELSDTVSRLEGVETVPEHAVEALCVELRETQARLREAEEQVARLTAEANAGATAASGSESASAAVDVRSTAEYVSVASQLSAALAALDKLAEEREALDQRVVELSSDLERVQSDKTSYYLSMVDLNNEVSDLRLQLKNNDVAVTEILSCLGDVSAECRGGNSSGDSSALLKAIEDLYSRLSSAKRNFELYSTCNSETGVTELIAARRSADRMNTARRHAEERLSTLEKELAKERVEVGRLNQECLFLRRELRLHGICFSYNSLDVEGSFASRLSAANVNDECSDETQLLQISSLQAELLLCRKRCRRFEVNQEELLTTLEHHVSQAEVSATNMAELRLDLAQLRLQFTQLQEEHSGLQDRFEDVNHSQLDELDRLRLQNDRLLCDLKEKSEKISAMEKEMRDAERSAKGRVNELLESLCIMEAQMGDLLKGAGSSVDSSESQQSDRVQGRALAARVSFLEQTSKRKEEEIQRLQDELLRKEDQLDQLEQRVTDSTQELDNAVKKVTHMESVVQRLQSAKDSLQEENRLLRAREVALTQHPSPSTAHVAELGALNQRPPRTGSAATVNMRTTRDNTAVVVPTALPSVSVGRRSTPTARTSGLTQARKRPRS